MNSEMAVIDWLKKKIENGPVSDDSLLYICLPLLKQVFSAHSEKKVAPLCGLNALRLENERLWFSSSDLKDPIYNKETLNRINPLGNEAVAVVSECKIDTTGNDIVRENLLVIQPGQPVKMPVYIPGFTSWEHEIDHHDELTDIFLLGMIMASLACGLNLALDEDLKKFAESGLNIYFFNPRLHPVIAKTICKMTELSRHKRVHDLSGIIEVLSNYRLHTDTTRNMPSLTCCNNEKMAGLRGSILKHLKERLFEISRRNSLIYFKNTLSMLNLTIGSVPVLLDHRHISPDSLFTLQGKLAEKLTQGKTIPLGDYLQFKDVPYLSGILDRINSEDRRNHKEYGFSRLKLALIFLRWHNLKEFKDERISSPLLFLPVKIDKKKGVKDLYYLVPLTTVAQVNPILKYHLKQLYGIELPSELDLSNQSIINFHKYIEKQIHSSEPGITLNYLDKPQISLIHKRAKIRLEQYRKQRRLTGKGIKRLDDIDYCYHRDNFQPLGLQLFLKKIKPSYWPLKEMSDAKPSPRIPAIIENDTETNNDIKEKSFYQIEQGSKHNPYVWDFDLCSITLGNFNYSKMSLVRDYDLLLENPGIEHPIFDDLFTTEPKKRSAEYPPTLNAEESFEIVTSDPTQSATVVKARSGRSLIIQGPPGTGKSQTITNLIADYIAGGKRVLFVCEKRSAIDVVYHRLKRHGLDQLCCLIHDIQTDKKAFIQELKETYLAYFERSDRFNEIEKERLKTVQSIKLNRIFLENFNMFMKSASGENDTDLRTIMELLISLKPHLPEFKETEGLPAYKIWKKHGKLIENLETALAYCGGENCFGKHPARLLGEKIVFSETPLKSIKTLSEKIRECMSDLQDILNNIKISFPMEKNIGEIRDFLNFVQTIREFTSFGLTSLLDRNHNLVTQLKELAGKRISLSADIEKAKKKTANWKEKISQQDIDDILPLIVSFENKFYRFLFPSFWKIRNVLNKHYNFGKHTIPPPFSRILQELNDEYEAVNRLSQEDEEFEKNFMPGNAEELLEKVEKFYSSEPSFNEIQKLFKKQILSSDNPKADAENLLKAIPVIRNMETFLNDFFAGADKIPLSNICKHLDDVTGISGKLPDILPSVKSLLSESKELFEIACRYPWKSETIQGALLLCELEKFYRENLQFKKVTADDIQKMAEELYLYRNSLMKLNAEFLIESVHSSFRKRVALSKLSENQIPEDKKEWRKLYRRGLREWEHEFGKIMRYKSIRDLASDESGLVLSDIKPIWLMSPLSVSDTIPLKTDAFDVVIFDEASQIPLEEAIPALFRARQAIVVGDEQQLPPTNFFSSRKNSNGDESSLVFEEDGVLQNYELDCDSFLTQASTCLPSSMLGWHYRSRHESLISFSNAAFYQRKLLTIPDCRLSSSYPPVEISCIEQGDEGNRIVLSRPVSFHHIQNGIYDKRRNSKEAMYIARLVRSLLNENNKLSIGIVAFSEAQQDEIETALELLSQEDCAFGERLEAEYEREEDEEFCGLFIKNLENVQGDERDIIILSVCYGYGPNGKMLMNFGPINKTGGEKRLNVIFSRARRHMAVVSSICYHDITNEYNTGANCLRQYLRYSEAVSLGNINASDMVLNELNAGKDICENEKTVYPVVKSISLALKEKGWKVDNQVGTSRFKCSIAVKKEGDRKYRLGILVDTALHYDNPNVIEQYIDRRKILEAFDWKILTVFTKDWFHDSNGVLKKIEALLKG